MVEETIFRVILLALVGAVLCTRPGRKKQFSRQQRVRRPREMSMVITICLWTMTVGLYISSLEWFNFSVPLGAGLRWGGVLLALFSIVLSVWVYQTLGEYFTPKLELLEEHQLVTEGPYRWMRHPLYAAFFLCIIATGLISANAAVMAAGAAVVTVMSVRIKKEEDMLTARFGHKYLEYKARTGAIFPKW